MREIKFRGKSEFNGKWYYGHGVYDGPQGVILFEKADFTVFVKRETVGQFTGLCDKNGKEIYEGDKVRHKNKDFEIVYCDASFCLANEEKGLLLSLFDIFGKLEVIGNTHD